LFYFRYLSLPLSPFPSNLSLFLFFFFLFFIFYFIFYPPDCETEVYIWSGKNSGNLKQSVAIILAQEFRTVFSDRPKWVTITSIFEGEEPICFKERFLFWEEKPVTPKPVITRPLPGISSIFSNISLPLFLSLSSSIFHVFFPLPHTLINRRSKRKRI
jgi:hypothetical protein